MFEFGQYVTSAQQTLLSNLRRMERREARHKRGAGVENSRRNNHLEMSQRV
jgi:flagellar biosynthesis/type III secretory pathway chaperone